MTYVKLNNTLYPATISGKITDREWDNRESKSITLDGDYATINALFPDGTTWSIVEEYTVQAVDEQGEPILDGDGNPTYTVQQNEYDNSEFYIRGDLTAHMDGTCTVKMGKETALENAMRALSILGYTEGE